MGYLTGPVNTLVDYQVEFSGLLMGPGTPYDIQPGQKLFDMAALKTMDQSRTWADGSWSGPDFADVFMPELAVGVGGQSLPAYAAARAAFERVFSPALVPAALWVKVPNVASRGIPAKTNQRALPIADAFGTYSLGAVQWRCPDPAWQSVPRTVVLGANGAAVSGMMFPLFTSTTLGVYALPGAIDFGSVAVSTSGAILSNSGNSPAWPVVVVTGPTPNFTIVLDGNNVSYGQAVPAGQTVTIDYASGLATLTGNVDRTYALTARNFSAVTSTSQVLYSSSGGTAQVTIADVWR